VDHEPLVRCQYCGGTAVVERRLRTIEPVISDGFITADAPAGAARVIKPSQVIDAVAQDESHCPTCGVELDAGTGLQAIRKCRHCGTQSKIERRLMRSPDADEALAKLEQEQMAGEARRLAATEALVERVENGADLAQRVRAAWELGEMWIHVNARAARLLPRILRLMRESDVRIEMPLAEIVGKLLCSDNVVFANAVLRAAEKFTFDLNGSLALIMQLSLGSGAGLKLLLDTADFAAQRGAVEYACCALWGVNTMIERNYAGRMRLAEIVLYRLLYLRGPVQGWAIELARGQLGLGCRFDTPTLLHFMDDCAAERPELIPYVRQWFYDGPAKTEAQFIARLDFVNELLTPWAKAAGLEQLNAPPDVASDEAISKCLQRLLQFTADAHLRASAIKAIVEIIDEEQTPRPCVVAMVQSQGDNLPEDVRRAFLRKVPGSPLLSELPPKYGDGRAEQRGELDAKLEEWKGMWNQGIRAVVDVYRERQRVAREYLETVKKGA
jgi:hypothetical protein